MNAKLCSLSDDIGDLQYERLDVYKRQDQDCAWKRGKECAVWVLAGEAFALTEAFMVVHRLTPCLLYTSRCV